MNTRITKRTIPARLLIGAIILTACLGASLLFRNAAQGAPGSPTVPTGSAVVGTGTSGTAPPRNINDLLATRQAIRQATATVPLPADLKHALIRWTAEIFKSAEDAGKTLSRARTGEVEVWFAGQDGTPKFVEMVLDRYRLPAIY